MNKPVVYWTSRALRVRDNPALVLASNIALKEKVPLKVLFVVFPHFPYANTRNMHFLLTGLMEMQSKLHELNIPLNCVLSDPVDYFRQHLTNMGTLVMDHHVLKPVKQVQSQVVSLCQQQMIPVHTVNVATVVPVEITSLKLEFAAKTFRPKIMKRYKEWLTESVPIPYHAFNQKILPSIIDVEQILQSLPQLKVLPLSPLTPGEEAGYQQLSSFIKHDLIRYEHRNNIGMKAQSYLSAYLHFGMISPKVMIQEVEKAMLPSSALFVEEAMVRRELAENYCHYNSHYDSLEGAWAWAKDTLTQHRLDPREYVYTLQEFEAGATHDDVWNHCMNTMKETGYLHSYLRMYWAKMVLNWSESAQSAIEILVHLNDTYFLDGRDPNGYTGIMWSVAGVHDRPWFNRPVIGLIRAMGKKGTLNKTKLKL